jgi:alpha-tubulin suppressor-like RCC1 family protein
MVKNARTSARWAPLLALLSALVAFAGCGSGASGGSGGGLGAGTTTGQEVDQPTAVATSTRFTSASAGNWHMCMLGTDGQARCWGSNANGQLGAASTQRCDDGNLDCSTTPLVAAGGAVFAHAFAGNLTSCGLASDGTAACWGMPGQVGDGSMTGGGTTAAPVAGNHHFTALFSTNASNVTCGLEADASVWCWGTGFYFGTKGPVASIAPVRWDAVSGTITWAKLSIGQGHACGLDTAGHAWCMGSALWGLLGDGAGLASATPVAVAGGHVFLDIAASQEHTCAIAQDGQAWCWGLGAGVGNNGSATQPQPTPIVVTTPQRFVSVVGSPNRSCALTADGSAWCWGEAGAGTLGDGQNATHTTPAAVVGGHHFASLAMSPVVTCGVDTDGKAWCWGSNDTGSLGIPLK